MNHGHDFISMPPCKNTEDAKIYRGNLESEVTMLLHHGKWDRTTATANWRKHKRSANKGESVMDERDNFILRFDDSGKVVARKLDFKGTTLEDTIEDKCGYLDFGEFL